ncbi:unnamed protein product [Meloidogyne enterolobii]|uniref:Uncharacterized protein n=1 Tax=Meloidogyne enterolobii TaxID=390850 RepID=A0ACB0ZWH9_MELEN
MFANQHLQQRNGLGLLLDSPDDLIDIYLSSDFGPNEFVTAPVPSSCFGEVGGGQRLEAGGPVRDEEEEEVRRRLLEPPNTSSLVPSTSNASMQKLLRVPVVKEEPFKDEPLEQDNVNVSQVFGSSSSRASSVASSVFTSVLSASHSGTPRKYRIKSDKEKSNPMYRLKRLKNNDAVRRSRDKARQQQMAKEHRLLFLEHENILFPQQSELGSFARILLAVGSVEKFFWVDFWLISFFLARVFVDRKTQKISSRLFHYDISRVSFQKTIKPEFLLLTREQAVLIQELKGQNAELKDEFQKIRQNCRCGAINLSEQQRH